MGVPEPTPELKRKDAERLLKTLESFKLTAAQKARWDPNLEAYRAMRRAARP